MYAAAGTFSSRKCSKNDENHSFHKIMKSPIKSLSTLCRRRFFPINMFKRKIRKPQKTWKSYLKAHLYSAAGAFSKKENHKIVKRWNLKKNIKIMFKSSSILCRRHPLPKNVSTNCEIMKNPENHENIFTHSSILCRKRFLQKNKTTKTRHVGLQKL